MIGGPSSGDVLSERENEERPSALTITELIRGRVPGVTTDERGRVRIRGHAGEPLYVVNGVPLLGLPSIPPSDVESIRILKGPETAIYGWRAGNGVIEIKTKRHK